MKGTHLAIQLAEHAIQFVSFRNNNVVNESLVSFEENSDDSKIAVLKKHFNDVSFLNEDFDDITLSWSFKRTTLVPNAIFADSKPTDIFELCYGKESLNYDIDYNRISELGVINVYEIPEWIKHFFVIKFPRIIIQHEGSHIVRQNLAENAFKLKGTVVLYQGYFHLTIVKHNNIEFYSSFDYQNHEDVIYHLMFALQQKEMTNESGSLEFILGPGIEDSILEKINTDIARVKDLHKLKVNQPKHFIAKSQLLCV